MPTAKNRFQILSLHPKIHSKNKKIPFFNRDLSKFYCNKAEYYMSWQRLSKKAEYYMHGRN